MAALLSPTMKQHFAEFKAAHPDDFTADGQMRICIAGGAGFIGSHIARTLKAEVCI